MLRSIDVFVDEVMRDSIADWLANNREVEILENAEWEFEGGYEECGF